MNSEEELCSNIIAKDLYEKLLSFAILTAEQDGLNLDYSHESIKEVEKILTKIHLHYLDTKDETGLRGIAVGFGVYIAETIRRNTNEGILYTDHKILGEKCFPFFWKESTLFPYAWCIKRMFDGEGDNVWTKYQVTVLSKLERTS